jgi:hypothetical protein
VGGERAREKRVEEKQALSPRRKEVKCKKGMSKKRQSRI